MDFTKLLERVKGILLTPDTEWGVIAKEPATVADLYKNYIIILAAIPPVFGFIKGSLIGVDLPILGSYRVGVGAGLTGMLISYALSLVQVYVLALIVDTLAPTFGGQKNLVQAMKTVAFAFTAAWIAGLGQIVPWLAVLITLGGAVYSIYLLYKGLPQTMLCPPDKAAAYTAVSIIVAIILSVVIGACVGFVTGSAVPLSRTSSSDSVVFDKDSPLAKLDSYTKKLEQASKQVDAAQQSGDSKAQGEAIGAMLGAALGGGTVEALPPERLEPFVPESLADLPRTSISAARNGAMGMQASEAQATFSNGEGRTLHLEISDLGSAKGVLALAAMASVQEDQKTDSGFSKTYQRDGRIVHEEWDEAGRGEYSEVIGERFTVKLSGDADSIDVLKEALNEIDLAGLEALKDEGVKDG